MKKKLLICDQLAIFILNVIANNMFCLGKLIKMGFNSSAYTSINYLRSRGLVGNVKSSANKKYKSYFITYRGRAFLYKHGDVRQEKYLTIQSS